MRVVGPYRTSLDFLFPMARDRSRASLEEARPDGGDSEESLEEISAEDFKRDAGSSVWMGYSIPRNYASNLYNIAWAQAVQNKPFTESMPTRAGLLAVGKDRASSVVAEDSNEYGGSEKEEGELEEGEIGFGSDMVDNEEAMNGVASDEQENQSGKGDPDMKGKIEEIDDFDKRVSLILEELESVTEEEAAASFETVCLRLRKSFENPKPMFSGVESSDTVLDALVQQAFLGIQTVHYVLNSNDARTKELNKDLLLRLLVHIKNQYSKLLTSQQICDIDAWLNSLVFEDRNKGKELPGDGRHVVNNNAPLFEDQCPSDLEKQSSISSCSNGNSVKNVLSRLEVSSLARGRGPLLDLHADYDENSLPSPTRDNPPQYPMPKPIGYVEGPNTYSQPIIPKRTEEKEPMLHSYAKDAVKAVSSYQQKWTSIPTINRLPSPTPSEEGNIGGDTLGEVSSSLNPKIADLTNSFTYFQTPKPICSGLYTNGAMTDQLGRNKLTTKGAPVANHVVKPTAKSRDPRLRLMNTEVSGSLDQIRRASVDPNNKNYGLMEGIQNNNKKHRHLDDSSPDDYSSKRPRNDFTRSKDMHSMSGRGGWLEDGKFVAAQPSNIIQPNNNSEFGNKKSGHEEDGFDRRPDATTDVPNSTVKQNPAFNPSDISFPSLLKLVTPTILEQLLEVEKRRLSAENQQKNSVAFSSTSASLSVSNDVGQNPPGKRQVLLSAVPVIPQIHMKPRDPRRILHSNVIQKSDNLISGQTRNGVSSSTQSSIDHITARESREQAQKSNSYSQSIITKPHISHQVASNPKHIASIVSSLQKANPPATLPISIKRDQPDVKASAAEGNDPKESSVVSEAGSACTSKLKNPWRDVEHLLDGYDDEQKAAIQKERARRIAEQNKMFAARKLCLVLDLDHTLLNSAKFVEIDPAHEDILRKKEEQDRERPQRHLYRFLHMGMWTKLRPGIWNFLDKASKLFELHLYTMGNKLYATEMAKILDPTGILFSGRVLSRGDDCEPFNGDERVPKSKDLDGVLGMESAVVIIDDSVRVWPHNRLNLIVVERYTYFPSSRRQFGLPGPSLLEIDHDERPEDGTLASSLAVIEKIHQIFFSHDSLNDVDVRNILASEQHKILAGCRILFSRIFRVGEANPHLHPLWQTAEQFGALCTNQIDEQVTHVVANCLGTDKVNWALASGRYVVQPGWVEASALLYRRANEHDFAVKIQ